MLDRDRLYYLSVFPAFIREPTGSFFNPFGTYLGGRMRKGFKGIHVVCIAALLTLAAGCGSSNQAGTQETAAPVQSTVAAESTIDEQAQAVESTVEESSEDSAQSHYPVTITTYDYAKNPVELTFTEKPTRVISGQQIWNEMFMYFDLDEYVVGAATSDSIVYGDFQERYDALPKLEDTWHNKEGIIALEPQAFFGWRSHFAEDSLGDVPEWIDRGINPVILNCANNACGEPSIDAVLQDFANLGAIFDIEDKTDAYIADANKMLDEINATVDALDHRKTVLMLEYYDGSTSVTAWGTKSLSGQMITYAGGENPVEETANISLEDIVSINPDKIILMNAGNSDTEEDRQSIYDAFYALEGLKNVTAVANEDVTIYALDDIYGGGIRIIPAIQSIYDWIYEEK